jgi:SAM-dependent methyltransferase
MSDEPKHPHTAFWDFSARIITPTVRRRILDPAAAHAVELGYGAGDLLVAASHFFGSVTALPLASGDDAESATRLTLAAARGNVSVHSGDEHSLASMQSEHADFIYSLHGVSRLPDLQTFRSLVADCARVLKPGGLAMLWFGRLSRLPFALPDSAWLKGYRVGAGNDGQPLLCLRMFHARRAVLATGMKAVALSTPLHPDTSWRLLRGGHLSFVTALKPGH